MVNIAIIWSANYQKILATFQWKTYIMDDEPIENAIIHIKNCHGIIVTQDGRVRLV